MRRRADELSPVEALTVALTTVTTFQTYAQHADTKVATVATVHLGTAAVAATQAGAFAEAAPLHPVLRLVTAVLAVLYVTGFVISGHHLLQGLRPRLDGPPGANRFGLAGQRGAVRRAGAAEQEREAWRLVSSLAELTRAKHARITRALPWTALMLVTTLVWLALAALYG
ncbi:hypothetical protein [Planomonospora parontospora]|uniref:hypothetical protein n=1 Tax=Planomonospora parontospora TaxID=58119 RepID=UPI00166FA983|nr:hypothetical protein [Planomonospora parontospora]GGL27960.1 hypothetical protein GCM10014719_31850 [Planomonospora parontospora subsp. antibiotica]GII16458.1 hypothetical protein Ppa05_31840 [Planomonospora parontospora subsp. antibiotica]